MLENFVADLPQLMISMQANASRNALEREKMRSQEMMALAELELSNLATTRQIELEKAEDYKQKTIDLQEQTGAITTSLQDLSDINATSNYNSVEVMDQILGGYEGVLESGIKTSVLNTKALADERATWQARYNAAAANNAMADRLNLELSHSLDIIAAQGDMPYRFEQGDKSLYFENTIAPKLEAEGKGELEIANARRIWSGMALDTPTKQEVEERFKEHVTGELTTRLDTNYATIGASWAALKGEEGTDIDALESLMSISEEGEDAFDALTDEQKLSLGGEISASLMQPDGITFMGYLNSPEGKTIEPYLRMMRGFDIALNNMQDDYSGYMNPLNLTKQLEGFNVNNAVGDILNQTTDPKEAFRLLENIYSEQGITDSATMDALYDSLAAGGEAVSPGFSDAIYQVALGEGDDASTELEMLSGDIDALIAKRDLIRNSENPDENQLISLNNQIKNLERQRSGAEDIANIAELVSATKDIQSKRAKITTAKKGAISGLTSAMSESPKLRKAMADIVGISGRRLLELGDTGLANEIINRAKQNPNMLNELLSIVRSEAKEWAGRGLSDNPFSWVGTKIGLLGDPEDAEQILTAWKDFEEDIMEYTSLTGTPIDRSAALKALEKIGE